MPEPIQTATGLSPSTEDASLPAATSGVAGDPLSPSGAPSDSGTPKTEPTKRELELQAELELIRKEKEESELQKNKAFKSDRQRREELNQIRKETGKYEELYNERDTELKVVTAELEGLRPQIDTLTAERDTLKKELESYRKVIIEKFDEADRDLVADVPLSKLEAHFQRLYADRQQTSTYVPSPSLGAGRVNGKPVPSNQPTTLEEWNAQRFGKK